MLKILTLIFLTTCGSLLAQNVAGVVVDANTRKPVQFVNIGIVGQNLGTVSDSDGEFQLVVDKSLDSDSMLFSVIGYEPRMIKIRELRNNISGEVEMKERKYEIDEVTIKPKDFKEKILGITSRSSMIEAGFKDNKLGYEYGILIKNKKPTYIKQVQANIAQCTYDTIFFRLNIYEVQGKDEFVNILKKPIYIYLLKENVENEIFVDLRSFNIVVEGDFLVAFEHVKDLGYGSLTFSTGFSKKTYYRKTSQGEWATSWIGISISVLADVEK